MKYFLYLLVFQVIPFFCFSQSQLPTIRNANWQSVGMLDIPVLTDSVQININDYGGDPTGIIDNSTALALAIKYLKSTNKTGIVYFNAGTYLFNSTIQLSDNLILKGTGAATTKLRFIMGGQGSLIVMSGSLDSLTNTNIIGNGIMNQYKARVTNPSLFNVGDMVKLVETDTTLMTSSWAYGNVGQVMKVKSVVGDSIEFYSSMRTFYPASNNPCLIKANTVKNVGITCMDIVRGDDGAYGGIFSNIEMDFASNCWLNGIQSDSAYYAHVTLNNCYQNIIRGSYFTNAYEYGGDGRAYGVDCQNSSSENLIVDNIFKRLRHSMLLQAGANGNVFAYNYSRDTYWVQNGYPSDVSGDIVFHGNYPFSNLFEGNILQNLVVDNTHGNNGKNNLFFRNRAENVGIVMNAGAGDSSAFIGNEVTTSQAKSATYFGLVYGQYVLSGTGNFTYGNNIKNIFQPNNITGLAENSYYLTYKPSFFGNNPWPSIGYPNPLNTGTVPAKARYEAASPTTCSSSSNIILALNNIVLSGKALAGMNNLIWVATATADATIFKIMVSEDGINFDSVAQQMALPTVAPTTYYNTFNLDGIQKASTLYYKIIAYQNGQITATSNIYAINNTIDVASELVTIYPNPSNSAVSAIFYSEKNKAATFKIIDQNGKTLLFTQIITADGWNKIKFSLSSFPAGVYYLVINFNGKIKTYPIVKK